MKSHDAPWRALAIFALVSCGISSAIALIAWTAHWTVGSPAWGALGSAVMWAPALARLVATRTVDRKFDRTLPLTTWGRTGVQVLLVPLALPLIVYGAAYLVAWQMGLAYWNPGGGRWTSGTRIALNLVVNLSLLGVIGTVTALGEEIGWRGYLQPRLDASGVRGSFVIVSLCQGLYHAPFIAGAGYLSTGHLAADLARFAVPDIALTFIWAAESYRAASLWPAVFFHSFHNTISQWLFPRLFAGGENELWLGEGGLLPAFGYVIAGIACYAWMRSRGVSWRSLTQGALRQRRSAGRDSPVLPDTR